MIRFEKMWAIARKEFSEFRRNRYVLMTLVIMPKGTDMTYTDVERPELKGMKF